MAPELSAGDVLPGIITGKELAVKELAVRESVLSCGVPPVEPNGMSVCTVLGEKLASVRLIVFPLTMQF